MPMTTTDAVSDGYHPFETDERLLDKAAYALGQSRVDGNSVAAEVRGAPEVECVREELRRTQRSLIQAEQMASLGGLVAGVAHEVSTPVGITLTAASHLAEQTEMICRAAARGPVRKADFNNYLSLAAEAAGLIMANARRAAELIQGFKQVAVDQTTSSRRVFNLKRTLEEILLSLSPPLRQAGHRVSLICTHGLDVDSYPGALSQVMTNLVLNSIIHAYDQGQVGVLTIRVVEAGDDQLDLLYSDDGKGIAPDFRPFVFDPFFTTRRGEGGTGLGLYIVANIVADALRGTITLEHPAQGTAFRIRFPRNVGPC